MPRKTAAQKAAEEAAAAEEQRRRTEQQRLIWAGAVIVALALFAGGYAIGQSNAEAAPGAFAPLGLDGFPFEGFDGELPPLPEDFDGDFAPFFEDFHGELPPFLEDFDGEFRFDFDPRMFDRPGIRDRFQHDLACDIVEREGRTVTLVCEGPLPFGDERPGDERRDDEDRRAFEPGFLGLGIRDTDEGIVVVELLDDGPAARAGIELDDVIVAFGDVEVRSSDHLSDLIFEAGAGSEVPITVRRFDAEVTVFVELGEWPD